MNADRHIRDQEQQARRTRRMTGALVVAVPVLFMVFFTLLQIRFDYPDILRKPAPEVLTKFHELSASLLPLWYGMFSSAILFIPLAVMVSRLERGRTGMLIVGVLAGLVQAIGLSRWVFVIPSLAESYLSEQSSPATRDACVVAFNALNRALGVGIGEHLGFLFTGIWTLLLCRALFAKRPIVSIVGAATGVGIMVGLLEPTGWAGWAGAVNAIAYTAWSLWMIVLGTLLIFRR